MNSRGLTLTELLVVIATLGILIATVTAGMNRARTNAFNAAALSCARYVRTAELELQTRTSQFGPYDQLNAGTIRACGFLTQPPPGTASSGAYQFAVRHPKGNRTYLISDRDLRWTSQPPAATLVMADATPIGGGDGSGAPATPVTPPVQDGFTRVTFTLNTPPAGAYYARINSACVGVYIQGATPAWSYAYVNQNGPARPSFTVDVPNGTRLIQATTNVTNAASNCQGVASTRPLYGARFGGVTSADALAQTLNASLTGGARTYALDIVPIRTAVNIAWLRADGTPVTDSDVQAYQAAGFFNTVFMQRASEMGRVLPMVVADDCDFPFQSDLHVSYRDYPTTETFSLHQGSVIRGFFPGNAQTVTVARPAEPAGCITVPVRTTL